MATSITKFFRKMSDTMEYCFNIESSTPLTSKECDRVRLLLADGFIMESVQDSSFIVGEKAELVELGPRLNFATAYSSNMVSICASIGLPQITRAERSRRYILAKDTNRATFINSHHDKMTECEYVEPLHTFDTGIEPEPVYDVPLLEGGPDALLDIPGISMDEWDRQFYYDYFVNKYKRNPTIVEIMDLNNANSEHSRHGFFKGKQIINGEEIKETLFDIVVDTWKANPDNSVIAFKDNSSGIIGREIETILPQRPGEISGFSLQSVFYHLLFTAETHNFPTGVAPFPGAETGAGGRIRDVQGTGKGGFVMAGTTGYCVGNLHIPGYPLAWEEDLECPGNLAPALQIEIDASNGASDYGNKFGEAMIQGFTRSFDMRLGNGERWGFLKPIMFTGGIGQIDQRHTEKDTPAPGMCIVQVGGPAYRVGFGGGAASSMLQGDNVADLDFNAVQRGDAEMEQKMNRVIRACNEMGDKTLIDVIHDQGAGGPANVLKELVETTGGWIGIRDIKVGDPTMSVLEIYVAEYQERNGFLISPQNIEKFKKICLREKVNCEVLGEATGDMRFVVKDERNNSTPVEIDLNELLGNIPQKTFTDKRVSSAIPKLSLPDNLTVKQALHDVFRLVSVGSKRFLTNKVDRSVTGLVARQQCCGPLQLPVSDVAIIAQSHFSLSGGATAIGEQPIKMIVDPKAGARMAIGEALTNLVWARVDSLDKIKCSANWMWAPKLKGEGAAIYDAANALRAAMITLGVAIDGGKDSLSMATRVGNDTVKSPRELVISVYGAMDNITKVASPDIKAPGNSTLLLIDLSGGKNRLAGSALAQVNKQVGNESPDMDDPEMLKRAFTAVHELLDQDLILAGHDRSDGGLITTVLEMAFAGNCGLNLNIAGNDTPLASLFSEELGLVLECELSQVDHVLSLLHKHNLTVISLGETLAKPKITLSYNNELILDEDMSTLREWWEETSHEIEKLQMNPLCAIAEKKAIFQRKGPQYTLPFSPTMPSSELLAQSNKPKVAILRDEGSNSDREMSSAFFAAGFEPWDVTMTDLLAGEVDLADFSGLAAVGGFSYADVPESAKGWAATIQVNEAIRQMFLDFYQRDDTFSLGVCNGCQLFGLLGWVPWLGIAPEKQPRFIANDSGRFESRWSTVKILESPAMMFKEMAGLVFGIHVDHGEGKLNFPDHDIAEKVKQQNLVPMAFVDDAGEQTDQYPFNPNGSPDGLTALCSEDGRHLAMMPHPERSFLAWQAHWLPEEIKKEMQQASPWLKMFQNAYEWVKNRG